MLCVTKRRSSWVCIGNPKLEQETIECTHAQETPAYQRRPTTPHEVQGSTPPIRALYMQLAKIPHTHQITPRYASCWRSVSAQSTTIIKRHGPVHSFTAERYSTATIKHCGISAVATRAGIPHYSSRVCSPEIFIRTFILARKLMLFLSRYRCCRQVRVARWWASALAPLSAMLLL